MKYYVANDIWVSIGLGYAQRLGRGIHYSVVLRSTTSGPSEAIVKFITFVCRNYIKEPALREKCAEHRTSIGAEASREIIELHSNVSNDHFSVTKKKKLCTFDPHIQATQSPTKQFIVS